MTVWPVVCTGRVGADTHTSKPIGFLDDTRPRGGGIEKTDVPQFHRDIVEMLLNRNLSEKARVDLQRRLDNRRATTTLVESNRGTSRIFTVVCLQCQPTRHRPVTLTETQVGQMIDLLGSVGVSYLDIGPTRL